MLTRAQKQEFTRNGFLVLDGELDADLTARARRAAWDAIPEDPDDASTWTPSEYRNVADDLADPEPFEEIHRRTFAYAESLVGEGVLTPPEGVMQVQLRFPDATDVADPGAARPRDLTGHVDGFGQYEETGEVGYTTMAAVVYLDRVEPRGGGFTVWPGSHRINERFFHEHSLERLGERKSSPPALAGAGDGFDFDRDLDDQFDPFEIHGDAGTVVLWHGKLMHCAGVNVSPNVRMAAIPRFTRAEGDDIKADAAEDIWKYWDGVEDPAVGASSDD